METFRADQFNDLISTKTEGTDWETSTDNGSVCDNSYGINKFQSRIHAKKHPTITMEEHNEDVEDSLTMINDLINPFDSIKRYLVQNNYISEKTKSNQEQVSQKLLTWAEEFSQNFYYAFIGQAVLKLSQGILNPSSKFLPSLVKLFRRDNLGICALLAVLGAGYKLGIEKMRKMSKHHDKINTAISIILASYSLFTDKSKMKKSSMYLFFFCQYLDIMSKILEKGKVIKKVRNFDVEFYELALLQFKIRFSLKIKISRRD